MKKLVALILTLLSLNSFAFGLNDCAELKSKDLAWVCEYMNREAFSGIDGFWQEVRLAKKIEKASMNDLHGILIELLNETEDQYFNVDIDQTRLNANNMEEEIEWIFSENQAAITPLKEYLIHSHLEAYSINGTFIYYADQGFVFVDSITREAFIMGGGDS